MRESEDLPAEAPGRDATQPWRYRVGRSWVTVGRFTYGAEHMRVRQFREGANLTIGAFCSIARGLRVYLVVITGSTGVRPFPSATSSRII
jgi:hypothetical protein